MGVDLYLSPESCSLSIGFVWPVIIEKLGGRDYRGGRWRGYPLISPFDVGVENGLAVRGESPVKRLLRRQKFGSQFFGDPESIASCVSVALGKLSGELLHASVP